MKRLLPLIFLLQPVFSVSLDQGTAERILKENRYFIEFIDTSVANFGTQKDIDTLKKAAQHNFQANLDYLQGNYVQTFKRIRMSQELLRDLYLNLTDRYLIDARRLLDISAPIIVQARDKKAQLFLRLGYRDLESSRQFKSFGYNVNRFLFSNKIRYYIDSIKRARRSKRFAFLALIESNTPYEDKSDYRTQTIDEALQKTEKEDISDYERVKNLLTNMLNRKLFENTYDFFLHHDDNYTFIAVNHNSIIRQMTSELKSETSDENAKKDKLNPADKTDNTRNPGTTGTDGTTNTTDTKETNATGNQ